MIEKPYLCCRQRAGPLVKECRALRPRLSSQDTAQERRDKNAILRANHSAVCRSRVDRLELRIAIFGYDGTHYTLTFDDAHLPDTFAGVRRALRAFLARAKRWNGDEPFDYIYCIEGKHGDRRYHVHMILRYSDLPPVVVSHLWTMGAVESEPVLCMRRYKDPRTGEWQEVCDGGFRRLAEYFNKERTDGFIIPLGRRPWSCSRSISAQLPAPERWEAPTGSVFVPGRCVWSSRGTVENDFGAYSYGSWIEPRGAAL